MPSISLEVLDKQVESLNISNRQTYLYWRALTAKTQPFPSALTYILLKHTHRKYTYYDSIGYTKKHLTLKRGRYANYQEGCAKPQNHSSYAN